MNKGTVEDIKIHAIAEYANDKRECCGFVVAVGRKELYMPCVNIAVPHPKTGKHDNFMISHKDYAIASDMGKIIAVVHSHPDLSAKPSEADLVECEKSGVPWIIASVFEDGVRDIRRIEPKGYVAPLIGRSFYHGVLDCYSLAQDYYRREHGIVLPEFERNDGWWEGEQELYLDNFMANGFYEVTDDTLKPGDGILMQVRSKRTNHAGIYLGDAVLKEGGDLWPMQNAMIHHFHGQLSERVAYGGYYKQVTRMVVRHKDLK